MTNSEKSVKKFLSKHKNHKTITAYRVVEVKKTKFDYFTRKDKPVTPQLLPPIYGGKPYVVGVNSSNSERKTIGRNNEEIGRGFHVCLLLSEAKYIANCGAYRKIIKVKCDIADLIAVDRWNERAVFKKFYIPKTEYAKAIA